jgi:hypothetical protein
MLCLANYDSLDHLHHNYQYANYVSLSRTLYLITRLLKAFYRITALAMFMLVTRSQVLNVIARNSSTVQFLLQTANHALFVLGSVFARCMSVIFPHGEPPNHSAPIVYTNFFMASLNIRLHLRQDSLSDTSETASPNLIRLSARNNRPVQPDFPDDDLKFATVVA